MTKAASATRRYRRLETDGDDQRYAAQRPDGVLAKLTGSDPKLREQAILYSAHHDHLGIGSDDRGGHDYNGALDNASGCAILIGWPGLGLTAKASARSISGRRCRGAGCLARPGWDRILPSRPAAPSSTRHDLRVRRVRDVTANGVERTTFLPTAEKITKLEAFASRPTEPEQA